MSVEIDRSESAESEDSLQYRVLSSAAVTSLLLGVLSSLAFLDWVWLCLPLAGIIVGIYGWRTISRRSEELTGGVLARLGVALSALCLIGGPARLTYEAAHLVPPGYDPISYEQLQPDPEVPGQIIPPAALQLEGKRVFIRGFVFPTEETRQFLLVRDQGSCCFGGNPKLSDRVQVTLVDPLRMVFRQRMFNVAGTFHVKPAAQTVGATGGVFYQLEADYLQ